MNTSWEGNVKRDSFFPSYIYHLTKYYPSIVWKRVSASMVGLRGFGFFFFFFSVLLSLLLRSVCLLSVLEKKDFFSLVAWEASFHHLISLCFPGWVTGEKPSLLSFLSLEDLEKLPFTVEKSFLVYFFNPISGMFYSSCTVFLHHYLTLFFPTLFTGYAHFPFDRSLCMASG